MTRLHINTVKMIKIVFLNASGKDFGVKIGKTRIKMQLLSHFRSRNDRILKFQ